jgi:phosphoglycerate kinase
MKLRRIQGVDVKGKIVFLRADVDVSLITKGKSSIIADDTRLNSWFPTLEYLVRKGAQVIVAGHLGRPAKQFIKDNEEYSLEPVAKWIAKKITSKPQGYQIGDFKAWKLAENVSILENLRFYKEEEENDEEFSKKLSSLAQIYVNDAFASSHRAHASVAGITKYLPSYAGLHLQKEVEELSKVLENPIRPLTIIIGGAKIETKLPLVEKMHKFANFVLVGGEVAKHTKELIKLEHEKAGFVKSILEIADLAENGKDINEYSINNFIKIIYGSKMVVWNGPMGEFEKDFNAGTREIAYGIIKSKAKSIVGGGDTVAFLEKEGILNKFSFVSTGGGAMLEFLAGEKLPGLIALK